MIETPLTRTPPLNETISLSTCFEPQICTSTMSCMLYHIFVMTVKTVGQISARGIYQPTAKQNKTKRNAQNNQNQNQNNKRKSAAKDKAVNKTSKKSTKKACMLNHQKRDPPNPNRSTSTSINSTQTETPQNPQNCPSAQPHNHSPTAKSRQKRCCCCCYCCRRCLSSPSPSP
jgi:hypothetical protein